MEGQNSKNSFVKGAAILAAAVIICKIFGALYKLPLYNMLGSNGTSTFLVTYNIYSLVLTVATAGIPVAMSRLVSAAIASGRYNQVKRYYNVAMPAFIVIGVVCMAVMIIFARQMAEFMGVPESEPGIRVLAPAVFFSCIVAIYRGYTQGFEDMSPTAVSQVIEVIFKMIFGLAIVYIFTKRGYGEAATSAGAIVGAAVGMGLSIPAMMFFKKKADKRLASFGPSTDEPDSIGETLKILLKVSVPITLSIVILNVVLLLNTKIIIERLQTAAGYTYTQAKDLDGVRGMAMTFFALPSAFIVPIDTSVVPAISAALTHNRPKEARRVMESALKLTNLFAMPAGIGLAVLAKPIFSGIYWGENPIGIPMLAILGFGAYFICLQLMTTAMIQAAGHEKLTVFTLPVGCIIQVIVVYFLVGNPRFGIIGATIGTAICYILISLLNMIFLKTKLKMPPRYIRTFVKPMFCSVVMGGAAWGVYGLMEKLLPQFAEMRIGMLAMLAVSVIVGIVVYAFLVIFIGAISRSDLQFVPKGDKIARFLKI